MSFFPPILYNICSSLVLYYKHNVFKIVEIEVKHWELILDNLQNTIFVLFLKGNNILIVLLVWIYPNFHCFLSLNCYLLK